MVTSEWDAEAAISSQYSSENETALFDIQIPAFHIPSLLPTHTHWLYVSYHTHTHAILVDKVDDAACICTRYTRTQ